MVPKKKGGTAANPSTSKALSHATAGGATNAGGANTTGGTTSTGNAAAVPIVVGVGVRGAGGSQLPRHSGENNHNGAGGAGAQLPPHRPAAERSHRSHNTHSGVNRDPSVAAAGGIATRHSPHPSQNRCDATLSGTVDHDQ